MNDASRRLSVLMKLAMRSEISMPIGTTIAA